MNTDNTELLTALYDTGFDSAMVITRPNDTVEIKLSAKDFSMLHRYVSLMSTIEAYHNQIVEAELLPDVVLLTARIHQDNSPAFPFKQSNPDTDIITYSYFYNPKVDELTVEMRINLHFEPAMIRILKLIQNIFDIDATVNSKHNIVYLNKRTESGHRLGWVSCPGSAPVLADCGDDCYVTAVDQAVTVIRSETNSRK